jgi:hypothetical protein
MAAPELANPSAVERQAHQNFGCRRLRPVFAEQREFVAAEPGDKCTLRRIFHTPRDLAEQRIANRVAEHVVDFLEAVEVDGEQGRKVRRIASRALGRHRDAR